MSARKCGKVADEYLRPINQGLQPLVQPRTFNLREQNVRPVVLPLMATSTRGAISGSSKLFAAQVRRDVLAGLGHIATTEVLQRDGGTKLSHESRDKIGTCCPASWVRGALSVTRQESYRRRAVTTQSEGEKDHETQHHLRSVRSGPRWHSRTIRDDGVRRGVLGATSKRVDRAAVERCWERLPHGG